MIPEYSSSDSGVSDVVGTILIILLVIGFAAVVAAYLMPNLFPKSVYIASEVGPVEVGQTGGLQTQVLYLLPKAGEPFYFTGQQKPAGGARVTMRALSPDGRNMTPVANEIIGNPYGQTLYIYPNNTPGTGPCDCVISPNLPKGPLRLMTNGKWTIQLIDEDAHILVMSNSDSRITEGTTALPRLGGTVGGYMYEADCSILGNTTPKGNLPISYNSTMSMYYRTFNGSVYMEYPNDPTLSFTGNMAVSLWLDPTNLGTDPTNSGNWHTILGKGILVDPVTGQENDNYQLVATGNVLYFEWNNVGGSQNHYHVQTNSAALTPGTWQYVTVNVAQNGIPQIYVNGVLQPSTEYTGNVPFGGSSTSVPVNLENDNYPMKIGMQNDPSQPFYYTGNIGNVALYNRVLTPDEIQQNLQTYGA